MVMNLSRTSRIRACATVVVCLCGAVASASVATANASLSPRMAGESPTTQTTTPTLPASGAAVGPPSEFAFDLPTVEEYAVQYADENGVSVATAEQMMRDNDVVLDFTRQEFSNPLFGAAWVGDDYRVNVRYLAADFDAKADALVLAVGRPIVRHVGGGSAATIFGLPERLRKAGFDDQVAYRLDIAAGLVEVWAGAEALAAFIDPTLLVKVDAPLIGEATTAASGSSVLFNQPGTPSYNSGRCTAGFTYKKPGSFTGFVTAGHCPDWNTYVDGNYSSSSNPVQQLCGVGGDYAWIHLQNSPNPLSTFLNKQSGAYWQLRVAGGFNLNQPTFKIGFDGSSDRTNTGQVIGYQTLGMSPGSYCPLGASYTGLYISNNQAEGDSGGPTLLAYNGQWYLAGLTNIGYQNLGTLPDGSAKFDNAGVFPVWNIPLPAGAYICNYNNPC